jgi:hypothetical protein
MIGRVIEALIKSAEATSAKSNASKRIVSKRAMKNKKVIKPSLLQKRPVHKSQQSRSRHLVTLIIQVSSMCECSIRKTKSPTQTSSEPKVPPITYPLPLKSQELDRLGEIKRLVMKKTPVSHNADRIKNAEYDAKVFLTGRKKEKRRQKD